jgi:hypothetical protein
MFIRPYTENGAWGVSKTIAFAIPPEPRPASLGEWLFANTLKMVHGGGVQNHRICHPTGNPAWNRWANGYSPLRRNGTRVAIFISYTIYPPAISQDY